jgi:hypothetical protein
MKEIFPKLETVYDPDRKSDTRYGGAIIVKRMWDYLDCDRLISSAGIQKRSEVPAGCLAFNYALKPMMDAGSIKRTSTRTKRDQLLQSLIPSHEQSTLNRFLNAPHPWLALNTLRVQALQSHRRTRALEEGLIVLDDIKLKKSGKRMEEIAYVWDPVEEKTVLGYDLVVLYYTDAEKSYPLNFAYKLKENDRISLAMQLAEDLDELGVEAKRVVFDTWYFALELITRLRDLGLTWVTRSKKNRLFTVDGATVHAEEIIRSGIKETVAQLPGYGQMKVVVAEINDDKRLLVTSDIGMKRKEVVKIYRDRFLIDNPFFRDSKQEMGLADFHTRRFRALVAHTVMCFLSYKLVSLVRLFDRELLDRTVGWVKKNLFRAVAGVKSVGEGLAVILGRGLELISSLSHAVSI